MRKLALLALMVLNLAGCTYALHQAEVQDVLPSIHSTKAVRITSDGEQFTILGFVTETEYVNKAYNDLQAKCPGGEITGINTRFSTAHGFFSWTNKVHMSGWCIN